MRSAPHLLLIQRDFAARWVSCPGGTRRAERLGTVAFGRGVRLSARGSPMDIVIEVRAHGSCWKVVEAAGVELIFPHEESALLYATNQPRAGHGEIRIFNSKGEIARVIPF
jgi:hypothetical protein